MRQYESIKVKSTIVDTPSPWLLIYLSYLPWLFVVAICHENLSWKFAAAVCRENLLEQFALGVCCSYLSSEFGAAICRRDLPWVIAVRIYSGYLPLVFCMYKQNLFWIYEQILLVLK